MSNGDTLILNKLVSAISPTIILHPKWKDSCPEWLIEKIKLERIINLNNNGNIATDLEALAYISTLSLSQPLNHTWFKIYSYLFNKVLPDKAKEIFKQQHETELEEYEKIELKKLKLWIFKQRSKREKERFK